MTDFAKSWNLSRQRFLDEINGLSAEQLRWKLHPNSLSIGQMAIHLAGVEVSFSSQLLDIPLDPEGQRLKAAATDGVVNDAAFPFADAEITPAFVSEALTTGRSMAEPLITSPSPEALAKEIKSALGPMISGEGALTRFGFHSGYHHGQAYLMKTHPGFPG